MLTTLDETSTATHVPAPLDGAALEGLRTLEARYAILGPFRGTPSRLPAASIERLAVFDQRTALTEQAVADYTKVLAQGDKLPPLTVLHVAGRFYLIDGHHRFAAFHQHAKLKNRGKSFSVPVTYFDGSPAEAVFAAVEKNAQHGVRLSTGERTDAAWKLILIGEKSRSEITRVTMVSRGRLTKMRQVKRALADDAANYPAWLRALHEASGRSQEPLDEMGLEERKRMKAEKIADQITRAISGQHAADPELMAMVMEVYMARRYAEFLFIGQRYCSEELAELVEDEAASPF